VSCLGRLVRFALPGLALALAGCANLPVRAPGWLTADMTYEGRMLLMDAEEQLAVAQTEAGEAELEVERAQAKVREAEKHLDKARDDDRVDEESRRRWIHETEGEVSFREAAREHALAERDAAQLSVRCARIRYELAKVEVSQKLRQPGAEEIAIEPFKSAQAECEGELAESRERVRQLSDSQLRAQAEWTRRKAARSRVSSRPGPYIE
jgi:chromosome segregation ATPase